MIGVDAKLEDRGIVEEFFQLFKTPWEFYKPGTRYDVLLLTGDDDILESEAPLVIIYGNKKIPFDLCDVGTSAIPSAQFFALWDGLQTPIYEKAVTFSNTKGPVVLCSKSGDVLGYEARNGSQRILRIGYDLFKEISFLLSKGQPIENALIPALDLHISMLRSWILETGIVLIEIPPVPLRYDFITCLTHDVDFIGIRQHFLDHSMGGFLYRATAGSLLEFCRGRTSLGKVGNNLKAALALPFVFLGLAKDPWNQFDRYLELEGDAPSTFFFIPFKNHPGEGFDKKRDKYRAARYDVDDVINIIKKIRTKGCEAGVHGIDAWHSVERGRKELDRIRGATGQKDIGIRMHWLCRNESTFSLLEQAGYHYDSTFGYNDTVGFKAGTAQVYKPVGVKDLLELPLHIQDTALFNPGRMNLTENQAAQLCDQVIERINQYQGVLTLLWHQRSLGPERLWGDFYQMLMQKLRSKNTWFATAGEVVNWFRIRRSANFKQNGEVDFSYPVKGNGKSPSLVLRKYTCGNNLASRGCLPEPRFRKIDMAFSQETIPPSLS